MSRFLYPVLLLLLVGAAVLAVSVGAGSLGDSNLRETFLTLRGYRLAAGFLAGAALAVGGVVVGGRLHKELHQLRLADAPFDQRGEHLTQGGTVRDKILRMRGIA